MDDELLKIEKMITSLSKRLTSNKDIQEDLYQEGQIGFLTAQRRYDNKSAASLSTFSYNYIKGTMLKFLKNECKHLYTELDENSLFDLDRELNKIDNIDLIKDCSEDYKKIINFMTEEGLTIREIAIKMNMSKSKVNRIVQAQREILNKKFKEI